MESRPATTTSPAEGVAKWLSDNQILPGEFEMFTDGSWKDNTPWMQHIFHGSTPANTVASASVVCLPTGPDRWTKPGLALHIAPSPGLHLNSGYPAELTALICACQAALLHRPAAIVTDCEAAFNIIKRGFIPRAEQKKDHATLARLLVRLSRKLTPQLFRHTHSHLDRFDLPPHLHSPDERGNILADRVADYDTAWIGQHSSTNYEVNSNAGGA
jgi:hypothetical protein